MLPLLKHNDWVMIDFRERKTYDIGDIVLIKKPGGLLLHRIIGKRENWYFSKGDNQKFMDAPVASNEMIGAMISIDNKSKIYDWFSPFVNYFFTIIGRIFSLLIQCFRSATGKEII